jgi:hypothetical protein
MSKNKGKKKKEEVPVLKDYHPEELVTALNVKFKEEEKEIEDLIEKLTKKNRDYEMQKKLYKEEAESVSKILEENTRTNEFLNKEIKLIREKRETFEQECKQNFDKKFEQAQEEKKIAIKNITDEMTKVKFNLDIINEDNQKLKEKVEKLDSEIQKLNLENTDTIQKYEAEIKDINEKHTNKLRETVNIFEKFLQNNKELLTTDLYTDYREMKTKFETKKNEYVDFKTKNSDLNEQNKMFKLSINNNDDIIKECARKQVLAKKKMKKIKEQIEQKDKILEKIRDEYQSKITGINDKFSKILQENELEIQYLKNELNIKNKKLMAIEYTSKIAMDARSELEVFFLEQLRECKIEIAKKKKMEEERRKNIFPFLNMSVSSHFSNNNNSGSTEDDSFFITTAKKVEIKDIEPEYKEQLLRNLLNKLYEEDNHNNSAIKLG